VVLHVKKLQSAMLPVAIKMCLHFSSKQFVAAVVVSHVDMVWQRQRCCHHSCSWSVEPCTSGHRRQTYK